MLRILLAMSLLATIPLSASGETPRDDAAAIMHAVIAKETIYKGRPIKDVCVVAATDGTTFEGRTYRLYATKEAAQNADPAPRYGWKAGNEPMLSEAIAAIRTVKQPVRLIPAIPPEWLPSPIKFCTPDDEWRRLTFSSPAIHDDVAFVYVDFKCPLCGHGTIYALRRTGAEWKIIDGATMWVS